MMLVQMLLLFLVVVVVVVAFMGCPCCFVDRLFSDFVIVGVFAFLPHFFEIFF